MVILTVLAISILIRCTSGCNAPVDFIFLIDGSESVSSASFIQQKAFVASQTLWYTISPTLVKLGVIVFSTNVSDVIHLNPFKSQEEFRNDVTHLGQPLDGSNIYLALRQLRQLFVKEGRRDTKKVGLLITDGKSRRLWNTFKEARLLRMSGITMIAIGVGDRISVSELSGLANEMFIRVKSFDELFTLSEKIYKFVCPDEVLSTSIPTLAKSSIISRPENNGLVLMKDKMSFAIPLDLFSGKTFHNDISDSDATKNSYKMTPQQQDPVAVFPMNTGNITPLSQQSRNQTFPLLPADKLSNAVTTPEANYSFPVIGTDNVTANVTSPYTITTPAATEDDDEVSDTTEALPGVPYRSAVKKPWNTIFSFFDIFSFNSQSTQRPSHRSLTSNVQISSSDSIHGKPPSDDDQNTREITLPPPPPIFVMEENDMVNDNQQNTTLGVDSNAGELSRKGNVLRNISGAGLGNERQNEGSARNTIYTNSNDAVQNTIEAKNSDNALGNKNGANNNKNTQRNTSSSKNNKNALQNTRSSKNNKDVLLKSKSSNIIENAFGNTSSSWNNKSILRNTTITGVQTQSHINKDDDEKKVPMAAWNAQDDDSKKQASQNTYNIMKSSKTAVPSITLFTINMNKNKNLPSLDDNLWSVASILNNVDKGFKSQKERRKSVKNVKPNKETQENARRNSADNRLFSSSSHKINREPMLKNVSDNVSNTKTVGDSRVTGDFYKVSKINRNTRYKVNFQDKNISNENYKSRSYLRKNQQNVTKVASDSRQKPMMGENKRRVGTNFNAMPRELTRYTNKKNPNVQTKTFMNPRNYWGQKNLPATNLAQTKQELKFKQSRGSKIQESRKLGLGRQRTGIRPYKPPPVSIIDKQVFNLRAKSSGQFSHRNYFKSKDSENFYRREVSFLPTSEYRKRIIRGKSFILPNNRTNTPSKGSDVECNNKPFARDSRYYLERVSGSKYEIRPCPDGTAYDVTSCACTIRTLVNGNRECRPELQLDFTVDFKDASGKNTAASPSKVDIGQGIAFFKGKGNIAVWRFSGSYIGKRLMITAVFWPDKNKGSRRQTIVGNCGTGSKMSYGIEIDKSLGIAIFTVDTNPRSPVTLKVPITLNDWNESTLIYDGLDLVGKINDVRRSVPLAGEIETRPSPLFIGGCSNQDAFHGQMDSIALYFCAPQRKIFLG